MPKEQGPYMLVDDDDGHWYVIPAKREADWDKWVGGEEWQDGNAPSYADSVGGSPRLIEIFSYRIN